MYTYVHVSAMDTIYNLTLVFRDNVMHISWNHLDSVTVTRLTDPRELIEQASTFPQIWIAAVGDEG